MKMSDFDQKKFVSALKCYIPNKVMLQDESINELCTVIRDIHSSFANAILNKAKHEHASEINASIVQASIDPLLPENLRRYAFANALRHLALYQSGFTERGEKEMANDITESEESEAARYDSDESSSVEMTNLVESGESQKEDSKRRSFLGTAWEWISSTTVQNQAENIEQTESETDEINETIEK